MSKGNIIRVTPVIDGTSGGLTAGDVLFNYTEIPNAVAVRGGVSRLVNISAYNRDAESSEFELILHSTGGINLGTNLHAQPDISDDNFASLNFLGHHLLQDNDWENVHSSADSSLMYYTGAAKTNAPTRPILLQADAGSRSVYCSGVAGDASNFADAKDLVLIFHIEYLYV